jgi:hypothetical protein
MATSQQIRHAREQTAKAYLLLLGWRRRRRQSDSWHPRTGWFYNIHDKSPIDRYAHAYNVTTWRALYTKLFRRDPLTGLAGLIDWNKSDETEETDGEESHARSITDP